MSDHIHELVVRVRRDMEGAAIIGMVPGHAYLALTELATIARDEWKKPRSCPSCGEYMVHIDTAEVIQQYVARALHAEAMCEWLAEHWLHDSDPYEVCLHNDITVADILKAASEAVAQK